MITRQKMSFQFINSNFKLLKIKKDQSINATASGSSLPEINHPRLTITQTDMFRIFAH